MSDPIRVGVVGTSGYADFMHLPSLASHPQAAIVAICGRNAERARELAEKYTIPQVFTDHRAMIDQAALDALVVAAPDDLHYAIARAALDANLHVLCEKPLALSAADAWALYALAEQKRRTHLVHFTYRWRPWYRAVRELLDAGYLGRIYECQLSCLGGYGRNAQYAWRFDGKRGHGILADLGSHMIDMARWLVADITSVSARLATFVQRPGADGGPLEPANDAAQLSLAFANGAQGSIHVSAVAQLGERGMEKHLALYGERGTLELHERGQHWELWGAHDGAERFEQLDVPAHIWGDVDPARHLDVFVKHSAGARHFVDAIIAGQMATPSFYDGARAQDVIDAALTSQRERRWVSVEHAGRP
ncbi:MAG: Gfo/Idh/MocA family oxidoreductase [Chloroflexales bacterium]|nr:Gfo/Idh/MocA family oxidoreductase [Chloroflexales bacterium]